MKGIYMMIGYPDENIFKEEFIFTQNCGLDFVEIGLPFNDAVADGPIIADAGEKVIESGINTENLMDFIGKHKKIKIYAMTYSNIVYSCGIKIFSDKYQDILDGVIIADLPNKYHYFFKDQGFKIPIIPFATTDTDINELSSYSCDKDFIYFVGLKGVTGSKADFQNQQIIDKIHALKKHTNKKVVFGFGIKTPEDASTVMNFADGFVVGTEVVKRQTDTEKFKEYVNSLGKVEKR